MKACILPQQLLLSVNSWCCREPLLTVKVFSFSNIRPDVRSASSSSLTSLCFRHLVPLTDLKPVNPVPAWNVAAPTRKGDLGAFTDH